MWALILGLIYDQSCKSILAGLARHQHRWI